jgi:uncharacterized protein (TIGR02145 family)
LYNWPAAQNACPNGWHIPSDQEWEQLAQYISDQKGPFIKGPQEYWEDDWEGVGGILKAASGWNENKNGSDDFGFGALPGGYRVRDGYFIYLTIDGFWWSNTTKTADLMWNRYILFSTAQFFRDHSLKENGQSIRCIKDYAIPSIQIKPKFMNL